MSKPKSIKDQLLEIGITYDKNRKVGYSYMLMKNGVDLGYYNVDQAIDKFLKQ